MGAIEAMEKAIGNVLSNFDRAHGHCKKTDYNKTYRTYSSVTP